MWLSNKNNALFDKRLVLIVIGIVVISSLIYFFYDQEKITVKSYAEQIMSKCNTDVDCTIDALKNVAENEDKKTLLTIFTDIVSHYEQSLPYCHQEVHRLGKVLYTFIDDLPLALSYADQTCSGAVYHAVVETFFEMQYLDDVDPEDIDITVICPTNPENSYALERWQCLHGVGHGLSKIYDHDVFLAVKRCEEFESGLEQVSCFKGTFMENIIQYKKIGDGTFSNDDIMFPCNTVDAKYAPACYHYHTNYLFKQKGGSISQTFNECDKVVPEEFVKYCYYGMGRHLSIQVFDNMEISIRVCKMGSSEYHSYCFAGMVMALVNIRGIDQGFEFCKIIPEENKEGCYDGLGKWLHMLYFSEAERTDGCSKAEEAYYEVCNKANLESLKLM